MKTKREGRASGMALVFVLVTVLLMSWVGVTVLKLTLFNQRMITNGHLNRASFLAAESVIAASMEEIVRLPAARDGLLSGGRRESCLHDDGLRSDNCDQPGFTPVSSGAGMPLAPIIATSSTRYLGGAPIPGFDADQLVYQQFVTRGRAHYSRTAGIPFGHLNQQTWRQTAPATNVFVQP